MFLFTYEAHSHTAPPPPRQLRGPLYWVGGTPVPWPIGAHRSQDATPVGPKGQGIFSFR